ncbi:MAG: HAD family hydrolase [Pseudomonadota bacterium]
MTLEGVRLVTVDLDDTVWPCRPAIEQAERKLFEWLERRAPRIAVHHDVQSLREHRKQLIRERPEIAHDLTRVRREHLRRLFGDYGYDAAIVEEGVILFRHERNQVQPYADVQPALVRLRARVILVSMTNGNAQVEHTPLRGLFHHELDAATVGAAKPHPAMFEAALRIGGVEARHAVHVGDDPERDIEAARLAGLRGVWVNRNGLAWPEDLPPPEATLTTFKGLDEVLIAG